MIRAGATLAFTTVLAACTAGDTVTIDAAGAAPPEVDTVVITGTSVSTDEVDFTFTDGPAYSLERRPTKGDPIAMPFVVIATLPAGTTAFADIGLDRGIGTRVTGGLNANWLFTYQVSVLLDGNPDTRFTPNPVQFDLATWYEATTPPMIGPQTSSATSMRTP